MTVTRILAPVLVVLAFSGCQGMSRVSIDSLVRDMVGPGSPAAAPKPAERPVAAAAPPRADTFFLTGDTRVVGDLAAVTVGPEDTLVDIARRYGVGYREIKAANPHVDTWVPHDGTTVLLPTRYILPHAPREGIVLNLATFRLFYYPPRRRGEARVVITHPIGIGREDWPTPRMVSHVSGKVVNPVWSVPASIRREHAAMGDPLPAAVPPGPDNPLGSYAMRMGNTSYLIHGTNKPAGIGRQVSHGCIQLYPEDIQALYRLVPVGTRVTIVDQPYLAAWQDGDLYFEAHEPLADRRTARATTRTLRKVLAHTLDQGPYPVEVDWNKVQDIASQGAGIPVPVERGKPSAEELVAAVPVYTPPAVPAVQQDKAVASQLGRSVASWYVQAGSYRDYLGARRMSAMLAHLGPPIPARAVVGQGMHKVVAGPFKSRHEAESIAKRIEMNLGAETLVVPPGI
ncbi:MAG: L,D-transpeptidase family protein [Gammaproteobacteria bacterium]